MEITHLVTLVLGQLKLNLRFRFGSNIQDCDDTRQYTIFNSIYGSGNISSSVMISSI
ncbi:hypothetical protein C0J52_27132 [Blattella germanica]|nr:hypothetical protein C0J52_27132 [Blattella germanica]